MAAAGVAAVVAAAVSGLRGRVSHDASASAAFTSLTNDTSSLPVPPTVACVDIVVRHLFLPCPALLWLQLHSKRSRRRSIIKGQSERTTTTWTAQTTSLLSSSP
eukprot:COSAG06_NODE_717_length_12831_cov_52.780003_17_plen_104_part_00